jgi:capsid protein
MARAPSTVVASPRYARLSGALNLPAAKYDKFSAIEWKPRRWQWVGPLKDTQANVIAVVNGFKSRQGIINEAGGDIEDVLDEIAADNQLAESKGVELDADQAAISLNQSADGF